MKTQELLSIVYRVPFRPFIIHVSGGSDYVVISPKDIGISKDGRILFHFSDGGTNTRIDADLVSEITEK